MQNFRSTGRRAVITLLAVYWSLIFVGTHIPLAPKGGVSVNDKFMHFSAYSGLAFLLAWAALRLHPTWEGCVVVFLVVAGYGLADEFSQNLIPHRTMEAMDWLADLCGGSLGLVLYYLSYRLCASFMAPACPTRALVRKDAA